MQHWTEENPCQNCAATSNTDHDPDCPNHGRYDRWGYPIVLDIKYVYPPKKD